MSLYKYELEPWDGKDSRHTCPNCRSPHEFSRYIDTDTGDILSLDVGKCNRENKCGYHYPPKQYFADNGIKPNPKGRHLIKPLQQSRPIDYIEDTVLINSLTKYDENSFLKYLHIILKNPTLVEQLAHVYKIGTSSQYGIGTTIFWQVDSEGKVRTGKLIKFDETGHRMKNCIGWVHSASHLENFNLKQCLFGEHLLKEDLDSPVGIVESEKTAVIMCAEEPSILWLACGGAEGLSYDKVKLLRGRNVTLFPDASIEGKTFNKWKHKAKEFGFELDNFLENHVSEEQKEEGVDLADLIVEF